MKFYGKSHHPSQFNKAEATMKYLWLTRFPPYSPLRGGDIEYSRELAHSLANHADVTGLAYATDGVVPPTDSPVAWEILPYRRPSPLLGIFSPLPDVAFRFKTAAYLERAIALACESDAVFVDFIGMAWLVKPLSEALKAKGKSVPIIVVTHNHEGALRLQASRSAGFPRRILLEFDAKKADKLEQEANRIADGITTIIQEDAVSFSQTCDTPMQVMLPGYSGDVRQERTIDDAVPRRATIIGNRNTRYKVAVLDHTLAALSAKGVDREVELEMGGAGNFADTAPRYPAVKFRNFIEE